MFSAAVSDVTLVTHNRSDVHEPPSLLHHQAMLPSPSSRATGTLANLGRPTDACANRSGGTNLVFVETVPGVLRCVATGGYPPPAMQLYIGHRDVTSDFGLRHVARLVGTKGLRVMHHVTERWSHSFAVDAADDGNRVTCVVTVSGLASTVCSAQLDVLRE